MKRECKYRADILLNPVAPHITEEMWEMTNGIGHIYQQSWPKYDQTLISSNEIEIAVQILGKIKSHVTIPADATEEEVKEIVLSDDKTLAALGDKPIRKFFYAKGRLVNLVI